jgi:hypothetical protein
MPRVACDAKLALGSDARLTDEHDLPLFDLNQTFTRRVRR